MQKLKKPPSLTLSQKGEKMTFKESYKKITESNAFNKFKKDNPDAILCAAFFITDFFGNDNKKSLDYKVKDKIFTFSLDEHDNIKMHEDKLIKESGNKFPELKEVNPNLEIDLDDIEGGAKVRALDEGISAKFNKIISVLQNYNHEGVEKEIWNLTCMLEGLIILHLLVDAKTGKIIKFERKSMMDLIRKK